MNLFRQFVQYEMPLQMANNDKHDYFGEINFINKKSKDLYVTIRT